MKKIQNSIELEHAVQILADAFKTDPVTNYMSRSDPARNAFFSITVKHLSLYTHLLDGKAVAVWYKNYEANKKSFWQYIKSPIRFCQMLYYASLDKLKELTEVSRNFKIFITQTCF